MKTFTVRRTSTPRWAGEQGRKTIFVVGGVVHGAAIPSLRAWAEAEALDGVNRVVLDVRAVVSCDRDGLVGLSRLRGRLESHPECVVDVVGARWTQFADVLGREGREGLAALQSVIRELGRPIMIDPYRSSVVASVPTPRSPESSARSTAVAE
jgi:hypothetical protein